MSESVHHASIYTKKGDKGETGLPGKRRLPKKELIFECLGALDETNAAIGLAISFQQAAISQQPGNDTHKQLTSALENIQRTLLAIGACIAAEDPTSALILGRLDEQTKQLEQLIDQWDAEMPPLANFILPGGTSASGCLHLCRTYIRRAERAYHRWQAVTSSEVALPLLQGDSELGRRVERPSLPERLAPVAQYLNRLSDFFFEAARYHNHQQNTADKIWKNN